MVVVVISEPYYMTLQEMPICTNRHTDELKIEAVWPVAILGHKLATALSGPTSDNFESAR